MNMKEKLESLGRNSIQLKIARKETYKLGATRFGGKPDVPPDFVWPTYEGESYDHVVKDRPLTFLAQFNCEELAQFDKEHLLPDHGLLSFFYETDTQCWGYDPKDMMTMATPRRKMSSPRQRRSASRSFKSSRKNAAG